MRNELKSLADSVMIELDKAVTPLIEFCLIQRVPERLHQLNKKAYKPRVVSIGPLHHGQQELEVMEKYKRWSLVGFLQQGWEIL